MIHIEWTSRAFTSLEALPQNIAFEIIRRADMLAGFPEMGAKFDGRFRYVKTFRQIIVKRRHRIIYNFDVLENRIYILSVQHCRQKLPATRDLKRREPEE